MIDKKVLLTTAGAILIGVTLLSVTAVNAQNNGVSDIVEKIAQRFNLNQNDVQKVFDELHQEKHAEMQAKIDERLSQAVEDKKITDAQKQAILEKFGQLKNKPDFEKLKNMSDEQRRQEMENKKTELENWAKENGLTLETLHELIGGPHKGMFFRMHK